MAKKPAEPKVELEREYIVPLRKGWLKVPEYKRANKAVKTLKEFIAQHMKVYDRDLRKIKVEVDLNNEIRFRGMRKPPARIKVRALKYDDGNVKVQLVDIPEKIKFKRLRQEKKKSEVDKKVKAKKDFKKKEENVKEPEKTDEEKKDTKEKEQSSKEETQQLAKQQAKQQKHASRIKEPIVQRKALAK